MKKIKILTAINNPSLNNKLNEEKNMDIVCKDIQYKEAIIDVLKNNNKTDLIIINEKIPGEIKDDFLINKIKEINKKIIIFYILEKHNNSKELFLKNNNVDEIFYNDKININNLIEIINNKYINNKIKNNENTNNENFINQSNDSKLVEIVNKKNKDLNNYIIEDYYNNSKIINKNNLIKKINNNILLKNFFIIIKNINKLFLIIINYLKGKINKIFKLNKYYKKNNNKFILNNKIITVSGPPNVGKTSFIINIIKKNKNKKTLLIDFDLKSQNIYLFLKIKKNTENINYNIDDKRIIINKINNNNYLISGLDLLSNFFNQKNKEKNNILYQQFFEYIKNNYDLILFDMGSENNTNNKNYIFENSNLNIVLMEGDLIGISKFNNFINNNKNIINPYIIINKNNKYSVDKKIIKNIINYNFLGEFKFKKY